MRPLCGIWPVAWSWLACLVHALGMLCCACYAAAVWACRRTSKQFGMAAELASRRVAWAKIFAHVGWWQLPGVARCGGVVTSTQRPDAEGALIEHRSQCVEISKGFQRV